MPDQNNMTPMPAPTFMPSTSTTVGTIGGLGLSPLLVWGLQSAFGVGMPPEVAASAGALIGQVLGYFFDGGRRRH